MKKKADLKYIFSSDIINLYLIKGEITMADAKKIAKTALGFAAGTAAAYYGFGGLLCTQVLGRKRLNKNPEDPLQDPIRMTRYVHDELFREADDWFENNMPSDHTILGADGIPLHAEIIKQPEVSHKWAILIHGYTSRPRTMANQGIHYYKQGFNTLFPYLRGHRKSEHKTCSMGYFERYDIVAWINYIAALDPQAEIILHGCSMGAATTMLTTGEELPANVKCAIADCGYTDCWEEYKEQISKVAHLPAFPFLNAADSFAKLFLGWGFKECSPLDAVSRSKTPTLFIHGEKDVFVPYAMMDVLYNACSAEKEKLSVPDAQHDQSCELHPEMYWEATDAFVAKFM